MSTIHNGLVWGGRKNGKRVLGDTMTHHDSYNNLENLLFSCCLEMAMGKVLLDLYQII
jgi:hypothetical protein